MPTTYPFSQVDVFTERPLLGNPVAVVHDSLGISTRVMQGFTDWTNLSEATFLSAPTAAGADYAVRIFSPGRELPFAGHPTLGSCHAWLAAGGSPKGSDVVQECGAGLVRVRSEAGKLWFKAPPLIRSGPLADDELAAVIACLRVDPALVAGHAWCDNGPNWRAVLLTSAAAVRGVRPDPAALRGMDIGVVGPHPPGEAADFEVRAFFPGSQGLTEDPVTGSLNAALGQWLIGDGHAGDEYTVTQGGALGRDGRVSVRRDGDEVWVGGHAISVISGGVEL